MDEDAAFENEVDEEWKMFGLTDLVCARWLLENEDTELEDKEDEMLGLPDLECTRWLLVDEDKVLEDGKEGRALADLVCARWLLEDERHISGTWSGLRK